MAEENKDEKKPLIKCLIEDIDYSRKIQEPFLKMWEEVEDVYNGEYNLPSVEGSNSEMVLPEDMDIDIGDEGFSVKSQLLYTKLKSIISILNIPADFSFTTVPRSETDSSDVQSAKIAKANLDYNFSVHKWWKKIRKAILTTFLYDRAYIREGFRPPEGDQEYKPSPDTTGVMFDLGGTTIPGQPYIKNIRNKDLLIANGFESLEEAKSPGGYIWIRSCVHIDWVKKNESYNQKARGKIKKGDVEFPHKEDEGDKKDVYPSGNKSVPVDLNYVWIYEGFYAPTPKYPNGRYFVVHPPTEGMLFRDKGEDGKDKLPFQDLVYPVRELVFYEPSDSYYSIPLAYRALNSQYSYEILETRILQLVEDIKNLTIFQDKKSAESAIDQMKHQGVHAFLYDSNLSNTPPQNIAVDFDTTSLEKSSLRARARFDSIFGIGDDQVSPLLEAQTATNQRINNLSSMKEANDLKIIVNDCIKDIAWDVINLTATNMADEMQRAITRRVDMTFPAESDATINSGKYSIVIEGSQILDLTVGDEFNVAHMLMTDLFQALQFPGMQDRLDIMPVLKEIIKKAGYPVQELTREPIQVSQLYENTYLLMNFPMMVSPTDDHLKHINEGIRGLNDAIRIINMAQQDDRIEVHFSNDGIQMLLGHLDEHIQTGEEQNIGQLSNAWKQAVNAVNQARQATSTISSQGQGAVSGAGNAGGNQIIGGQV